MSTVQDLKKKNKKHNKNSLFSFLKYLAVSLAFNGWTIPPGFSFIFK